MKLTKQILTAFLAAVLVLSTVPFMQVETVSAASTENRGLITLNKKESQIAPGITQEIATVRKQYNGQQMAYYTMTVDTGKEYNHIYLNYRNNDWDAYKNGNYGLQAVKKQMDAAQQKHANDPNYTVVGGINGTSYDMSNGNSNAYILVSEGREINKVNNQSFFAVRKDGTAFIGWDQTAYDTAMNSNNPIMEAIGMFTGPLIKNGQNVATDWSKTDTPDCNARTAIGVTGAGKVVMLVVDGKQAPYSEGCDMYELAEILQKAGCVDAFNLDGGGSTTFVSRPEGESTYRVINKPCDGSPRSVATSLMVVSTYVSEERFDHAALTADADYITPNGTVNLTAKGVNPMGAPFEIPEDVTWQLSNDSFGTVTGNSSGAVFTSNGTEGDVEVRMMYGGRSVGSTTVHVVKPTKFEFKRNTYAALYGEKFDLDFNVKYEEKDEKGTVTAEHDVAFHKGNVTLSVEPETAGTFDFVTFTTAKKEDGAPETATFKAKFNFDGFSNDEANFKLLEESESKKVVYNFDDTSQKANFTVGTNNSSNFDNQVKVEQQIVSRDKGKVKDGNGALKVTVDYSGLQDTAIGAGVWQIILEDTSKTNSKESIKDAMGVGYWVWIPDEDDWMALQVRVMSKNDRSITAVNEYGNNQEGVNYDEGHWYYVYKDLSDFAGQDMYINPKWFSVMLHGQESGSDPIKSVNNKLTYYIDSYTVDYTTVHDDRTMPVIGNVTDADSGVVLTREEPYVFDGTNTVSFTAPVSDATEGRNYGIDVESAKAYIDGKEIVASVKGGEIVTDAATLAPGEHTLKLYISDKSGNTTNATRRFTVGSADAATVQLVPSKKNKYTDKIPIHSVFYMDVKATDISKIQEVTMEMDLNNISTWELDHAEVNPNFKMDVSQEGFYAQDENIATVTFTRNGEQIDYESDVIASLPVRTWDGGFSADQSKSAYDHTVKDDQKKDVRVGAFFPVDVSVEVDRGEIKYVDGTDPGTLPIFGGGVQVDTELFTFSNDMVRMPEYEDVHSWHFHDEPAVSGDQEATCTEFGYSGRTICETCGSPVEWGEVIPPNGHTYVIEDGVRKCSVCGELFTGVYEGLTYKDGKLLDEQWEDDRYYKDGKSVTGVQKTKDGDGTERYHNFGTDGHCVDQEDGYTGFFRAEKDGESYVAVTELPTDEDLKTGDYYYVEAGLPHSGWLYFRSDGETKKPDETSQKDQETPEENDEMTEEEREQKEQEILGTLVYHIGTDNRVHRVKITDTRKCTESGYLNYTCTGCDATEQSEKLWWVGHDWEIHADGSRTCNVCQKEGMDISKATLNIMGENFEYTGKEIRAAVLVFYKGLSLSVRSDKNGLNGYVTYDNNTEIGTATVNIEGTGDFYGQLTGTFHIVPRSVKTVTKTETHSQNDKQVQINLSWDKVDEASYYTVIRYDYDNQKWIEVAPNTTETTFQESLNLGTQYRYQVASRAKGNDGQIYYSYYWSDPVNGTAEHAWGEETNRVEATCSQEGSYDHTCTVCGLTETVTVPKLPHTVPADGWRITKPATTSTEGERTGICSVCGETVTESIAKLPSVQTGTHSSSAPGTNQETVTHPDGSTTTTTTTPDGSTTETTTQTDGTVSEKTTKADGTILETTNQADGTVKEKVTQPDGSAVERTTTPEGITGQTSTDATGKVTSTDVTIPESVKSGFVTAPVEVPAAKSTQEAPEINLKVGSADTGKVEIPVTEFGPGTVAILVHEDGTEEVVRDCTIGENGVILNVEGDVTLKIVERSQNFTDVASGNWASDAVEFVAARELFQGTGNQQFTPEGNMTRGMLVTVLYRLAYEPEAAQVDFGDIDQQAYYSDAVAWAASNGVVTGYSDHAFGPDDDITREQLATILYRYAKNHTAATGQTAALSTFADASQISPYAAEAMSWAVSSGLINGVGNNQLAPEGEATRAQVATMLMRFCEQGM